MTASLGRNSSSIGYLDSVNFFIVLENIIMLRCIRWSSWWDEIIINLRQLRVEVTQIIKHITFPPWWRHPIKGRIFRQLINKQIIWIKKI